MPSAIKTDGDWIEQWLREYDPTRLEQLWAAADRVRREMVGEAVHVRGLVEFSNECSRSCAYCGLRRGNQELMRYRMGTGEVLACAETCLRLGYGSIVLASGEFLDISRDWLGKIISRIHCQYGISITLSVGERPLDDYRHWFDQGADQILLRFETSNQQLFNRLHPQGPQGQASRIKLLQALRQIGYEIGSGTMVGLPGQTVTSIARDIQMYADLDLDTIGLGPYIPNGETPLGQNPPRRRYDASTTVSSPGPMALKALALARIACPDANVVTYAALAPSDTDGLMLGLQYGANVVMPRLTSAKYQNLYRVYPAPSYAHGPNSPSRVKTVLDKLGRPQAQGRGHRRDRKAEASRSSGKKPGEGLAIPPDSSRPTS